MRLVETSGQKKWGGVSFCAVLLNHLDSFYSIVCNLTVSQITVRYVVKGMPGIVVFNHLIVAMKVGQRLGIFDVIVTAWSSWVKDLPHPNGSVAIFFEVLGDRCGIGVVSPVLIISYPPHVVGVWSPASE